LKISVQRIEATSDGVEGGGPVGFQLDVHQALGQIAVAEHVKQLSARLKVDR